LCWLSLLLRLRLTEQAGASGGRLAEQTTPLLLLLLRLLLLLVRLTKDASAEGIGGRLGSGGTKQASRLRLVVIRST
jgi:hypothetical protein